MIKYRLSTLISQPPIYWSICATKISLKLLCLYFQLLYYLII